MQRDGRGEGQETPDTVGTMSTDFGDISHPVAHKSHRCAWCGEAIVSETGILRPIRLRHVKFSGKWSGEFQNWRMHSECYNIANENDELSDGFSLYEHERPAREAVGETYRCD